MSNEIPLPPECTFEPDDWRILARHWYPIALADEVVEAPHKAMLLDEPLVAYRVKGSLVVARDVCPHRGVPLTIGHHDGEGVVCRYHGLRYGVEGRCNRIPASPNVPIPEKLKLVTYPAVERYGLVWVCLAPEAGAPAGGSLVPAGDSLVPAGDSLAGRSVAAPDVPVMPHYDDPDFQQIVCPRVDIDCFAGRQLEGFIDVAHFGFVHAATFGDPDNVAVPPYVPKQTPKGFQADYRSSVGNYPIGVDGRAPPGFEWLRHFEVHLPFTATLTIHFPDEGRLVIMNAASPVSARRTRMFAPIARNFDKHIPVSEVHAFNLRIFEEDRLIVETQKPERLPLDLALEAHISADRSSIAYRRGLKRMGLGQFFLV